MMSPATLAFLLSVGLLILVTPKRWAAVFLLSGMIYLTKGEGIQIGGTMMHSHRLLLLCGVGRAILRGEFSGLRLVAIDKIVLAYCGWMLFASLFHEQAEGSGFMNKLGGVFSTLSAFFLLRTWSRDEGNVQFLAKALVFLLLPVAISMSIEKVTRTNPMELFGGGSWVLVREGIARARGPFTHPILAGSFAAACAPLLAGIWGQNKTLALVGFGATVTMVATCHSSGPLISLVVTCAFVAFWYFRHLAKHAVWIGLIGYLVIEVLSNRPAYHAIVTRLDMTGSSTAYYRCLLIDTTIEHFDEWWLFGTDRTSHWISSGIGSIVADGKHIDITNMFIAAGVNSGFIGMCFLLAIVLVPVRFAVQLAANPTLDEGESFRIWCYGAALASLGVSGLSTSFFDQSGALLWFLAGFIGSVMEDATDPEWALDEAEEEEDSLGARPTYS